MATNIILVVLGVSLVKSGLAGKLPASDRGKATMVDLFMPAVQPKEKDTYLCHGLKLDKTLYITGFKPKADMMVAHHILLYGCSEPGGDDKPWNCGEMLVTSQRYKPGPVCKSGERILYAWAMDAPELVLPKHVAFEVGGKTGISYLVLQVHYKDVTSFLPPKNLKDSSGIALKTTSVPQAKLAGVYLMGTDGEIPAHSTTYMETACTFTENAVLHPFAFRVHSHKLGRVVAGYRVREGVWTEIGRKNPQSPQMFYPVEAADMTIVKGDTLAARCTMVNEDNFTVAIGPTMEDEMCNFYMMYYVDGFENIQDNFCFTPGPPAWKWMNLESINPENIPRNASVVPDTNLFLDETKQVVADVDNDIQRQTQALLDQLRDLYTADLYDSLESDLNAYEEPNPWRDRVSNEFDDLSYKIPFDENIDNNRYDFDEQAFPDFSSQITDNETPAKAETFSIIDDKNGGKGYEKSSKMMKHLNIPGGKGFYKESRKESGFTWEDPSTREDTSEINQM